MLDVMSKLYSAFGSEDVVLSVRRASAFWGQSMALRVSLYPRGRQPLHHEFVLTHEVIANNDQRAADRWIEKTIHTLKAALEPRPPTTAKHCYQCDAEVTYLFEDGCCGKCTRIDPDAQ